MTYSHIRSLFLGTPRPREQRATLRPALVRVAEARVRVTRLALYIFHFNHRSAHSLHCTSNMEYKPRYPQPFTLELAVGLDVSMITEGLSLCYRRFDLWT